MVSMPRPEYPLEARRKLIVGRGVYQLIVRPETGVVTRVSVLQSTGSNILDEGIFPLARAAWPGQSHTSSCHL